MREVLPIRDCKGNHSGYICKNSYAKFQRRLLSQRLNGALGFFWLNGGFGKPVLLLRSADLSASVVEGIRFYDRQPGIEPNQSLPKI